MNICIVNLSDRELNNEQLNQLFNSTPPRSVILLEDVDAAFVQRDSESQNGVTFSGLLNALGEPSSLPSPPPDGVAAQEGGLLFMTTNKFELLDPALIRPGRVDLTCFFGYATQFQVTELFKRFFPKATAQQVSNFVEAVPGKKGSKFPLEPSRWCSIHGRVAGVFIEGQRGHWTGLGQRKAVCG